MRKHPQGQMVIVQSLYSVRILGMLASAHATPSMFFKQLGPGLKPHSWPCGFQLTSHSPLSQSFQIIVHCIGNEPVTHCCHSYTKEAPLRILSG